MKANEIEDGKVLMIGDFVIGCIETDIVGEATYKIPCKVTDIHHYGDVICEPLKSFPDELDWQEGDDFSWIEPIPLTAEILEKNEWRCFNTYHSYSHPKAPFELRQQKDGGYTIEVDADEYGKAVFLFIHYVHELQHALRLCGIDKEIVL